MIYLHSPNIRYIETCRL